MRVLKVIWTRWQVLGRRIADLQARALLFVFYFTVFGPFALGVKVLGDPLRLHPGAANGWVARPGADADPLTLARRQF
ncbi:MAG: hypothetical protein HYS14_07005 [Candidatus Rokubacteria bacterium]|nr:hypothetical protein [Candidatus Rokubacteria bacterium]